MVPIPIRKAYFLSPSDNISPGTGIKLGQVFCDLKRANERVGEPVPISQGNIHTDNKYSWRWLCSGNFSTEMTISAKILSLFLGFGPEVGGSLSRESKIEYRATRLETIYFEPDLDYVNASLTTADVLNFVSDNPSVDLFMITGIKIAYGASKRAVDANTRGAKVGTSWEATGAGIPVSGGIESEFSSHSGTSESYSGSTDMVLAFKVNKIITRRPFGTVKTVPQLRGTVLDNRVQVSDPVRSIDDDPESVDGQEIPERNETLDGDGEESEDEILADEYMDDDDVGECFLVTFTND